MQESEHTFHCGSSVAPDIRSGGEGAEQSNPKPLNNHKELRKVFCAGCGWHCELYPLGDPEDVPPFCSIKNRQLTRFEIAELLNNPNNIIQDFKRRWERTGGD